MVSKIKEFVDKIRFNIIMDLVEGGVFLTEAKSSIERLTDNEVVLLKIELFEVV